MRYVIRRHAHATAGSALLAAGHGGAMQRAASSGINEVLWGWDTVGYMQRQAAKDVAGGSSYGSEPVVGVPYGSPYKTESSPLVRV